MKKNFIFTLITVLSVVGLVHAEPSKRQTTKRIKARDLKFQRVDNPGQFADTQHSVYYSYPVKAVRNK